MSWTFELWDALLQRPVVIAILMGVLLVGGAMVISRIAARSRRDDLLAAIEASTRGAATLYPARERGAIACTLTPAPEPFSHLFIYFTMRPRPWPLGFVSILFGGRSQRIEMRGVLRRPPHSELTWQRHQTPGRATGRGGPTELWSVHRLPASQGEYALRGANARGLEHLFVEAIARYGGFVQRVLVRADRPPHVQIVLAANGLNAEDIPPLVTTLCALGRAAARE